MDIITAKETVIKAGKQLVEYGLIARTWGNVSCRVDEDSFVITPSGKPYMTLTPDDIVLVKISDLSYEGDVKPSSEKGVHASCYKLRPETNFVIHTHQMNASAVSALGFDINGIDGRSKDIIGNNIPICGYGLPGTKKLKNAVIAALKRSDSKAVVMAHHGAVCLGKDYDEAFAVAAEVELVCEKFIVRKYKEVTGKAGETFDDVVKYLSDKFRKGEQARQLTKYDSIRDGVNMVLLTKDGDEAATINVMCGCHKGEVPQEATLHAAVYNSRADISYIIHSDKPEIHAVSITGKKLLSLLDDFAQIAGPTVKSVKYITGKNEKKVTKALKCGRNAVFLKDNGALCCGKDKYNAEATEMVVEKNSKTYLTSKLFDNVKPINAIETRLMNLVYRLKYSKQAD